MSKNRSDKRQNFETALEKLETIVDRMEVGGLLLDDSLKMYQEGVELSRFCIEQLDAAENRIEMIAKEGAGKIRIRDFVVNSSGELSSKEHDPENSSEPEARE